LPRTLFPKKPGHERYQDHREPGDESGFLGGGVSEAPGLEKVSSKEKKPKDKGFFPRPISAAEEREGAKEGQGKP